MTPAVVTISAGYGAGGGIVGPVVARQLGLPFVDRSIPTAVSASLAVPLADAMAYDERSETGIGRILSNIARSMPAFGPVPEGVLGEDTFRQRTEQILHETADTTGGVILGRAGMIVLATHPRALHVCLHGPVEARIGLLFEEVGSVTRIVAATRTSGTSTGATPTTRGCTTWPSTRPRSTSTPAPSSSCSRHARSSAVDVGPRGRRARVPVSAASHRALELRLGHLRAALQVLLPRLFVELLFRPTARTTV